MKKFYSFLIVAAAVAMVSCAGNANKSADAEAVEEVAVEACEACCEKADSACCEKACCQEEAAEAAAEAQAE